MTTATDGERYRRALEQALALGLRTREAEQVDVDTPLDSWPGLEDLLDGLINRYSELLGIQVEGEESDFLLWDAVDVRATYGPGHAPDCEHLCIAILALEGAVRKVASPNWDGLIEGAFTELGAEVADFVHVVVLDGELRGPDRQLTLIKFHGCAVRATEDEANYRHALVATRRQITEWVGSDARRVIRNELIGLATNKSTLMVGLSAQDEDIQQAFAQAANNKSWTWPATPPPHVFADGSLGDHHLNILRVIYGDENASTIEPQVLVPAYAKAFFPALVLLVLARKLRAFLIEADAPQLDSAEREELAAGLGVLAERLAAAASSDRLAFIQQIAAGQGRALTLFQDGVEPSVTGPAAFRPLGALAAERIKTDPTLSTSGVRELAVALALIGRGAAAGTWTAEAGSATVAGKGPLELVSPTRTSAVFFAANGRAATRLMAEGLVDPTAAEVVVIHSTEPVKRPSRSSRARYGRTGQTRMREVDMCDLLKTSPSLAALEDRFRQVAGL